MLSLSRILIPVDFSNRCQGAARYARTLAARLHSEVVLLHILPPPHYEFSPLEVNGSVLNELFANRNAQAQSELDNYLCEELEGLNVKRLLKDGDPAKTLVAFAHSEKIELIMMPTHGYGTFRRFILGSVAAKVLHDADCPVWTGVHLEQAPAVKKMAFQNIVVALDLGAQSRRTLDWAASLAEEFEGRLNLVHALPCMERRQDKAPCPEMNVKLVEQAREEIEKLQKDAGTQAQVYIEGGDAPQVVCEVAERLGAEVTVIGRGSAAGIFGRLRANAYAIIRQSSCPVVSV